MSLRGQCRHVFPKVHHSSHLAGACRRLGQRSQNFFSTTAAVASTTFGPAEAEMHYSNRSSDQVLKVALHGDSTKQILSGRISYRVLSFSNLYIHKQNDSIIFKKSECLTPHIFQMSEEQVQQ